MVKKVEIRKGKSLYGLGIFYQRHDFRWLRCCWWERLRWSGRVHPLKPGYKLLPGVGKRARR